ncbi:MAG: hypothetical protein P1P88_04730 [Bacteroidales bacterium]|nr:hypothetical protein [Bacteroidales bacterium]
MSLIKLTIDDIKVSLPLDFVIRLTFKMPMPYYDNVPAAITYWFNLMSNDINDRIFKHGNFVYSVKKLRVYDCILDIAGLQMKGKLYLKNATFKDYKAFIVFNDLIEGLAKNKIADVVDYSYYMGADATEVTAEMERLQLLSFPDANYGFPSILNSIFIEDNIYTGRLNRWDFTGSVYQKNYYYAPYDIAYNITAMVPQPYLLHVLEEIFKSIDFSIIGDINTDANFRKLLLYSNYAEQQFVKNNYFLGNEIAASFAVDGNQNYIDIDTVVEDDDNTFNVSLNSYTSAEDGDFLIRFIAEGTYNGSNPTGATFSVYVFSGGIAVGQVVTTVLTQGVTTYIEGYTVVNASNPTFTFFMTSQNAGYVGTVDISSIQLEVYPKINQRIDIFSSIFELSNHVPEVSVSDFINAFNKKFCLATFFDFKNKKVEFTSWNKIIESDKYIDLTSELIKDSEDISYEQKVFSFITTWENDDLTEKNFLVKNSAGMQINNQILQTYSTPTARGQFLLITPANLVYISDIDDTGAMVWKYYSDYFQDIISTEVEAEEISIKISTLFFRQAASGTKTYYPAIELSGGSKQLGKSDAGLKIYNNHGFQVVDALKIPFASNTNKDFSGNTIPGFNLNMADDDGLYNKMHKKLYDYINSRNKIEYDFDINNDTFLSLVKIFSAESDIRRVRVGFKNYLPELLDISIGLKEFKNCKITLR